MATILILIVMFAIVAYLSKKDNEWMVGFVPLGMVTLVALCVSIGIWTGQCDRVESVIAQKASIELNKERVESISIEIKRTLTEIAPQHEQNIFDSMSPVRIALFASAYPQLQANTSLMKYCDLIVELTGEIQNMQSDVLTTEAKIRSTRRNIFIPFNWWLPVE